MATKRLCLGVLCALACAALLHALLVGWVFQESSLLNRPTPVPFELSVRLAVEGVAPPAWAYMGWLHDNGEKQRRTESMLSPSASHALRDAYVDKGLRVLGWVIALACVERWGALCEWFRVGLVRMGMTSRPPAQKSSWIMRGMRQGLAIGVCAAAMLVLALTNPAYDPKPVRLGPIMSNRGLAWGEGAPWLAAHGMLP